VSSATAFSTARYRSRLHQRRRRSDGQSGSATLSPEAEDRRQLRRAVIASTVGTTIEWYDFFLYSTVTGLVFAQLYFPKSDPLVGTLQAFAIYAVGFVARPVGAAIFGHYGDRIGRKSTLVATLLLMGVATFLVAFVPTYEPVGIWGAGLLTILRFIQGVGVGGEWGGSVLMSMEWTKTNAHRGFVASWPQFGVPAGLFLANLRCWCQRDIGRPFVLGAAHSVFPQHRSVVIGLWIRQHPSKHRCSPWPREQDPGHSLLEVIKRQPKKSAVSARAHGQRRRSISSPPCLRGTRFWRFARSAALAV
jgi:hypothetical protein